MDEDEKKFPAGENGEKKPPGGVSYNRDSLGEENLVFYYSREHRLEKASPEVRALNAAGAAPRRGLFRTLTHSKSSSFLLLSIVIIVAAIIMVSTLGAREGQTDFWDNTLTLRALKFEGTTYLLIKKKVKNADKAYSGDVDLAVSPQGKDAKDGQGEYPVTTRRLFFSLEAEEEFRVELPFEGEKLLVLLQNDRGVKKYTVTIE